MRYEIDIIHYWNVYKKEWKKIVLLMTIAIIIAAIVGYLQPVTYRSTVIALSSKEGGQSLNLGSFGLGNISVTNSSSDTIFSILESRRMSSDIDKRFNPLGNPHFWWNLDTYTVTGGFAVEVTGFSPEITMEIANFAVENVDKINKEIGVSAESRMIKVLDSAIKGMPVERNISKRSIASGLIVFLICMLFVFFKEYFSNMKRSVK